jgi:endonuclease G
MPTLLQTAFAKETLLQCTGYQPKFIDETVNISVDTIVPKKLRNCLPVVEGEAKGKLHYTGLSVLYNCERRLPFVSAYNIDGAKKSSTVKRAGKFRADPRIAADVQLGEDFYDLRKSGETEFEVGHMAANNEMAWGKAAQLQSYQTFHYPNSVPQAEKLNTGIWKSLETYITKEAATVKNNKRIAVFTGPVLMDKDPAYVEDPSFQIPLLFYKVIVFMHPKGLFSTAFVMSHEERMKELGMFIVPKRIVRKTAEEKFFEDFEYKKVFQINVGTLEKLTGLKFTWKGVQKLKLPVDKNQVLKIRSIKDAAGAKENMKGIVSKKMLTTQPVTDKEIKSKKFKLNVFLP